MRIRAKLGSRRLPVSVTGSEDRTTVADVIRCAAAAFNLENDVISVSLNGEVFLNASEGDLDTAAWGLVPGDLVHLRSALEVDSQPEEPARDPRPVTESDIRSTSPMQSSMSEYFTASVSSLSLPSVPTEAFPRILFDMARTFDPKTPCQYIALVCHSLFTDASFSPPPNDLFEPRWTGDTAVIRLPYVYKIPQIKAPEKAPVTITLMDCDQFVTANAQIAMDDSPGSFFSTALQVDQFVKTDTMRSRLRLVNQSDLANKLRDELLEKIRQDLHSYFGLLPVGLLRLPNELQFRILRYLDCKSLCRMERCCSHYRYLARPIWRCLFQRDFREEFGRMNKSTVSDWKLVYQEHFERAKALAEARRHTLERTEAFSFQFPNDDWPPNLWHPEPLRPLPRPPGPGMLGGAHDLWPMPLMPPGPMPGPFRPWFRHPRP